MKNYLIYTDTGDIASFIETNDTHLVLTHAIDLEGLDDDIRQNSDKYKVDLATLSIVRKEGV